MTRVAQKVTGVGQSIVIDVRELASVAVHMKGGSINATGVNLAIEASIDSTDGSDGTWFAIIAARSNSGTALESVTGAINLNAGVALGYGWRVNAAGYSWIRFRSTALTAGEVWVSMVASEFAVEPAPSMPSINIASVVPTTSSTALGKAEDAAAASGDTGVATLGVRVPATPAAQTSAAGDYGTVAITAEGKQVAAGQGAEDHTWQTWGAIPTTEADVRAAQAAGIRQYITDCTMENTTDTFARASVKDGASTVLFAFTVPPRSTVTHAFKTPLRGTAATAIRAVGQAGLNMALTGYNGI